MDKVVLEGNGKRLTIEEKEGTISINFFSLEEENEFSISKENKEIYDIFDKNISSATKDNKTLMGEQIKEVMITSDEDLFLSDSLMIEVLNESIHFVFSSPYHSKTTFNIKEDVVFMKKIYDSLLKLNMNYYQAYIDEMFKEGREFKLELRWN